MAYPQLFQNQGTGLGADSLWQAAMPQTIARDGSNILWFEIDCGKQPRYSYNDDQMTPAGICRESGQGHARQRDRAP